MSTSPSLHPGARLTSSVRAWSRAAIVSVIALGVVLAWLHSGQADTLRRSRQLLAEHRRVRIDLAEGFLHFTLTVPPGSPFREDTGMARLERALAALRNEELAIRAVADAPNLGELLAGLAPRRTAFQERLIAYGRADPAAREALKVPLQLAFQELVEGVERLDAAGQDTLLALASRQNTRFAVFGSIALALLGALSTGAYQVGRQQAASVRALLHSEESLRGTNRFLSDLIEHSAAVIFVKDREGRYELVNRRWEEETGIRRERAVGQTDQTLFPGRIAESFGQIDRRVLETERPVESEESLGPEPGGKTFLVIKFPVRSDDGRPRGVCGIATEITARTKAEALLRERLELQDQFAKLVVTVPGVIFSFRLGPDKRMSVPFSTPRMEDLWGVSPESVRDDFAPAFARVHPDDVEHVWNSIRQSALTLEPWRDSFRVRHPTRGELWLEGHSVPRLDPDGSVLWHGFVQDITGRQRAEDVARQNEARLNFALEAGHTGAWSLDIRNRTSTRTPIHARIFGYAPGEGEWSLQRFFEHIVPADRETVRQTVQTGIANHSGWNFECRIRRTDGAIRWVFIAGGFENEARSSQVYGIIQDITERKQIEAERTAMEAQLRHQQKLESIGTLASGVAHEINNPVTGIMNYAQLIQDRLPADSPLTEFSSEILRETKRVADIVRNLLTFARNEKQRHSPARVRDIVEAVLSLIQTFIRRDQITLDLRVPEDLPLLKCRSQQIQQVLMNLVTNARDALNGRYPEYHPDKILRLEARLFEKAGRRWIRLTVEDHGTGITPPVRERMFDPFFTTKGRNAGTGLGLSISHGIVKDHHGEWTVETEPDQFTRMHIDLPIDNGWEV